MLYIYFITVRFLFIPFFSPFSFIHSFCRPLSLFPLLYFQPVSLLLGEDGSLVSDAIWSTFIHRSHCDYDDECLGYNGTGR